MYNSFIRIVLTIVMVSPTLTFAQDDESADRSGGFHQQIQQSRGVMIRVPRDASGRENTDLAEIRIYNGDVEVDGSTQLRNVWGEATDASSQRQLRADEVVRDASTWGWYGRWGGNYGYNYSGYGWRTGYYYSYNPCYYYGGTYYSYSYPYYNSYSGYSYYYYPSTYYYY